MDATRTALETVAEVVGRMSTGLARRIERNGRVDRTLLDDMQPEAFELARTLGELEAARAAVSFAEGQGDFERELAATWVAGVVRRTIDRVQSSDAWGIDGDGGLVACLPFVRETFATGRMQRVAGELLERASARSGAYGLEPEHAEVRELFARFADERVAPLAEHIHRRDDILPEDLLSDLAELGVFGISIPEEWGGHHVDTLTMCLATEELSRASLGAGGSVITRPEICARALLKGGSDEQKRTWLPAIAAGKRIVSVAVTEPNAGSDVAALRVTARAVDGGYVINGEKTWCTFAGRADVFILLARTGSVEDGARGLTLFLVEKPPTISESLHHHFAHTQQEGGRVEGHAIPTVGYRGMHSFTVSFEDWFVPDSHRVGDEGQGFALQMEGFAGGRIQTAARAVGVMEAAFRAALDYVTDRRVFGSPLATYSMTSAKLVTMAAAIMASRHFTYRVADLMDEGKGAMEASLVKLVSCRDAEWVTREAMQLHGGMGYSQEYAVSRYWQDARVLSIFEGAEEILALYVVARRHLDGIIREQGA